MALSKSALSELLVALRAGGDLDVVRGGLALVLRALIDAEAAQHIGARPYERTEQRTAHRNGSRSRRLSTRPVMWSCGSPSSLCVLSTLSPDSVRWRLVRLTSRADDGQVVEGEQAAGLGGSSRPHADGLASEVVASTRYIRGLGEPEGPGAALGTRSSLTATSASGRPLGDR